LFSDDFVHENEVFVWIDAFDTPGSPHDAVFLWGAVEAYATSAKRNYSFADYAFTITDSREIGPVTVVVKKKYKRVVFIRIEQIFALFLR